jgi:hypothetical protein
VQLRCLRELIPVTSLRGSRGALRMHYADLSPSGQFLLIGLLAIASLALVTRAMIFFHREKAGTRPIYPATWSAAQCRTLEYFRLLVGLALIPLWGSFLFVAPSMRADWAFGHLDVIFLILLLWISNAWVLLLVPRNWQKFSAISRSFWITITFLVVWWGATFTATEWMLVKVLAPPTDLISGAYAARGAPPPTTASSDFNTRCFGTKIMASRRFARNRTGSCRLA